MVLPRVSLHLVKIVMFGNPDGILKEAMWFKPPPDILKPLVILM